MSRKSAILRNSSMGLITQVTAILFNFLTRKLFIDCIGFELLGLNGTFASVLNTLSLAELGFQTAIVYSLYKPIHDGNTGEINDIMNILKLIYRVIGIFFIAGSVAVLPFLRFILKDVEVTPRIYGYFLLQASASTCTYFLAYKRAILYADQKDYVTKFIDMLANIAFNIAQCVCLVAFRNYVLYLVLKTAQTYLSNLIVHVYCGRHYAYLKKDRVNREKLRAIWGDVRNIFAGRIAAYIYQSTDNLVISTFVGTVSVALVGNYTMVLNSLRTLTYSMLSPITPVIGNYLVDESDPAQREETFLMYSHVRYILALMIVIPTAVLIDGFIAMCFGENLALSRLMVALLAVDFYIHLVHGATLDFINSLGMFRADRTIEIIGAVSNIVTSIILVQVMGIEGVLVGTVFSQFIFWFGRSYIVYFKGLRLSAGRFARYWLRNGVCMAVAAVIYLACAALNARLPFGGRLARFFVGGVMCEAVVLAAVLIGFSGTREQKTVLAAVKSRLRRR